MSRRDPFAPVIDDRVAQLVREVAVTGTSPWAVPVASSSGPVAVFADGRRRVNLGSNNYLGLTTHPRVVSAALAAVEKYGTGVSGSRQLNGTTDMVLELEAELADFYGAEAAVVTPSGFTANLAVLSAVGRPRDTILVDSRSHASLHLGAAASRARVVRWAHNDVAALVRRLEQVDEGAGVVVVVDGVYSMEGETAPLPDLVAVCRAAGARLVVDEAHGLGVLGTEGRGAAEALGVLPDVDAVTVTMSKALASCGGAVITTADVADGLRTASVPYVFAAGNVPASVAAAQAALRVLRSEPDRLRAVRTRADLLRSALVSHGVRVLPSAGAVVAVLIGSDDDTVTAWRALFDAGVFANASIHPAVAVDHGVLRFSVMATHTDQQILQAAAAIASALPTSGASVPEQVRRVIDLDAASARADVG